MREMVGGMGARDGGSDGCKRWWDGRVHIASRECKLSPLELVPVQGVITTRVVVTPLDGATWLVEVTQQSVLGVCSK